MVFSATGGLSSQQQAKVKAEKGRAVQQLYEADYRRVMQQLAAAIKAAKGSVKAALEDLRDRCTAEREAVSERAQAEFDAAVVKLRKRREDYLTFRRDEEKVELARMQGERQKLSNDIKAYRKQWPDIFKGERLAAKEEFEKFVVLARATRDAAVRETRTACMTRGSSVLQEARAELTKLHAARTERLNDRRFSKVMNNKSPKAKAPRATQQRGKAPLGETDDEVRANIEPFLIPLFNNMKKSITGKDGMSRTQHFLQIVGNRNAKTRTPPKPKNAITAKHRAKERADESDDEVRSNIEPRLVPLFDMVKKTVTGNDRLSRTEHFQQMYEEDRDNMDAMLWAAEEEATTALLEKEYKERMEEKVAKERVARRKEVKQSQTQLADISGRGLAEKKTRQRSILDAPPPRTKTQSGADALFGVPF